MKKIVLVALVAMVALSCGKKVKPVEEVVEKTLVDSIVLVEGAGDVVNDQFIAQIPATETEPAHNSALVLHHQQTLTNGVFERAVITLVNAETGETATTTEAGRYQTLDGFEFPVVELTTFDGQLLSFWAVKDGGLEMLDGEKLPLAVPYVMSRVALTETAAVAEGEAVPAE